MTMTARKCYECKSVMRSQRKDYRYKECGLPNVMLREILVHTCPTCGAEEPEIGCVASLHRAIMMDILKKESVLCGEEIRFLRKMSRMTAVELSKLVGAGPTSFSK